MDRIDLYRAARQFADEVFEIANEHHIFLIDQRRQEPNPYYHYTADGLLFEVYYDIPGHLHTPWGQWNFAGSGSGEWGQLMPALLERWGAVLREPVRFSTQGQFGPIYELTRWGDRPLPAAMTRGEPLEYETARDEWQTLSVQYSHQ